MRRSLKGRILTLIAVAILVVLLIPLPSYASSTEGQEEDNSSLDVEINEQLSFEHAPRQIIVSLRDEVTDGEVVDFFLSHSLGADQVETINQERKTYLIHLSEENDISEEEQMNRMLEVFLNDDDVEYAEPNYDVYISGSIPNDTYFSNQWNLNNTTYGGIDAVNAWDIERGNESVIVAVIDSGIVPHEDIDWNRYVSGAAFDGSENFLDEISPGVNGHGHGTAITGIIAATSNNATGVAGICWNGVRIMPLDVFFQYWCEEDKKFKSKSEVGYVVSAIDHAVACGAKVINMSLSMNADAYVVREAIEAATEAGCIVVAAAGNGDEDSGLPFPQVRWPARLPETIAVGANDIAGNIVYHPGLWSSNYGVGLDVLAPGDMLYYTQGNFVVSTVPTNYIHNEFDGSAYEYYGGTSIATPHVSGVAALLASKYPHLSPAWIKNIILSSASRPPQYDDLHYGYGILDAYEAFQHIPNVPTDPMDPNDQNVVKSKWYFAEGSTRPGFEEFICVQNPTDEVARVEFLFMMPDSGGEPLRHAWEMGAQSRQTLAVHDFIAGDVSVLVISDKQIYAERAMYWTDASGNKIEGHACRGTSTPGTQWYLAEGSTREGEGFDEWVLVQNPGDTEATVTLTFMMPGGETCAKEVKIPAASRHTEHLNEIDALEDKDVSTLVTSDVPVFAERAMYWDFPDPNKRDPETARGGHCAPGVPEPAEIWYLAEGSTGVNNQTGNNYEEWILVQNPGSEWASVTITFMNLTGVAGEVELNMEPTSRKSVLVNEVVPDEYHVSTLVTSDQEVIAERAMYWPPLNYFGKGAGHVSEGITTPASTWYLAEGCTLDFTTWVLIQNPGEEEANVSLTYMTDSGAYQGWSGPLPPKTRYTVPVHQERLNEVNISTKVVSDQPVIAERAMYWANGQVTVEGGTCTVGIPDEGTLAGSNTDTGSPVAIELDGMIVIFDEVTSPGNTILNWSIVDNLEEGSPILIDLFSRGFPYNLSIAHLATTADYEDGIDDHDDMEIWASYDPIMDPEGLHEEDLRLLRYDAGKAAWEDITSEDGIDTENNVVKGRSDSTGMFCVVVPWASFYEGAFSPQDPGVSDALLDISALNSDAAWAVGFGQDGYGTILKTTDGGGNWLEQTSQLANPLMGVSAVDADTAWVVGYLGISKTTDGGDNWITQASGTTNPLMGVSAVDADTAWAVGMGGIILKTSDGGDNWITQDSGITDDLYRVSAVDADTAWALARTADDMGIILKTTDGGNTWINQYSEANTSIYGISAVDADTAWAAGFDQNAFGIVLKTTDGGNSWVTEFTGDQESIALAMMFMGISAVDANTVWVVGPITALSTNDGGATWDFQWTGNIYLAMLTQTLPPVFLSVSAVDAETAWAVGLFSEGQGAIYRADAGPDIIYITPRAEAGEYVEILGFDYGSTQGSSYVSFGGIQAAEYKAWSDQRIEVKVPPGVSGDVEVAVTTQEGQSNAVSFHAMTTAGNTPQGSNVEVSLAGGVVVSFETVDVAGNTSASPQSDPEVDDGFEVLGASCHDITTTAGYSGKISVSIPYDESQIAVPEQDLKMLHEEGDAWVDVSREVDMEGNRVVGEVDSLSSFVIAWETLPEIASISPTSGSAGDEVVIEGTCFGDEQGTSYVSFGGAQATVISWSATQITCTVPPGISGQVEVGVCSESGTSNYVPFTVTVSTELAINDPGQAQYSDDGIISATLADNEGTALVGKELVFSYEGTTYIAITDGEGCASATYSIGEPSGLYTIGCEFSGEGIYLPSQDSADLQVVKEQAYLEYNGEYLWSSSDAATLSAILAEEEDGSPGEIVKAGEVVFGIHDPDGILVREVSATVTETSSGVGAASVTTDPLPANVYTLTTSLAENGYYQAELADSQLVVYNPDGGFVTGGGYLGEGQGKCNFGFNVKYGSWGVLFPQGHLNFHDKAQDVRIEAFAFSWMVIPSSADIAYVAGSCTLNDVGGYHLYMVAEDGDTDYLHIVITDSQNQVVYEIQNPLGGGNIKIHGG